MNRAVVSGVPFLSSANSGRPPSSKRSRYLEVWQRFDGTWATSMAGQRRSLLRLLPRACEILREGSADPCMRRSGVSAAPVSPFLPKLCI